MGLMLSGGAFYTEESSDHLFHERFHTSLPLLGRDGTESRDKSHMKELFRRAGALHLVFLQPPS